MSPRTHSDQLAAGELRALREALGLTREQAAQATGYSERQFARWEAGEVPARPAIIAALEALRPTSTDGAGSEFDFIDLFAGIGGFRLGFEAAQGRCVFTSEWDPWAQKTYKANFGDHELHGDIREIDAKSIPDHDVLLAGFPCQPFSIAGVSKKNALGMRHGFECNTQGTLFFDIERIVAAKQPRAFVLENVKNLASHDRGNTFRVIKTTLSEKLGYRIATKIIDARFWVPQHRERLIIVGLHPDLESRFDFREVRIPPAAEAPRLRSILHPTDGSGPVEEAYTDDAGRPLKRYILSDHLWNYLQDYASKHRAKGNGFGFGLVTPNDVARTLSARYYKDGSEILISRGRGNPRRLTPRECARLMGFDGDGRPPFRIPVSDTQAYKQFGNSIVVPMVTAIARALVPYLKGERVGTGLQEELELELV